MDLMHRILEFFGNSPDYKVPAILCEDFQGVAFPGGRVRRGFWKGWKHDEKRRRRSVYPDDEQSMHFKMLATSNFENLLLKQKQGGELTRREKIYLDSWKSPQTVRIAALGVYCKYEGYVGVVKDTIDQNPQL